MSREINDYIQVRILGGCLHPDWVPGNAEMVCPSCGASGKQTRRQLWPNYCSDNSPRSLLNEVIEKFDAVELSNHIADQRTPHPEDRYEFADCIVKATAEQTARACVSLHKLFSEVATCPSS